MNRTGYSSLFLDYVAQTSDAPMMLEVVKAQGCTMYDPQGKPYLDLIAGISVSNMGHSHPAIVEAVKQQAEQYMHVMVYGEFVESPQVKYAEWISKHFHGGQHAVFFVNSGSEAIETALKLAKRVTGRSSIISFENAYHGATHGALSIGGDEERKNAFRPLVPGNISLPFNNTEALSLIDENVAAVVIEPVQGEAGVIPADKTYLQTLRKICTEKGVLLVFDECQSGFGRTGAMFASQYYDVQPDITTLGKALGGGMPLGAVVAPKHLLDSFQSSPVLGHITTFGGHPVCCAAGLAAAQLISPELLQGVKQKEQLFLDLLKHESIVEVRTAGLLIAVEFKDATTNFEVIKQMIERGIITDWFLYADHSLRIAPPLIISEEEIKFACLSLIEILDKIKY